LKPAPDFILVLVGIGFIIASLADLGGFSLAIGAFFAGLVFSRDDEVVKRESSFMPLYELFSPFFFIGIGLQVDPVALGSGLKMGIVLAALAFVSKILGNGLPVWFLRGIPSAALIGISMVPRAEITMVIMQHGLNQGSWAMPPRVFNAMVMVTILTCTISPILVQTLLERWPQAEEAR
jgi:Kef-type K+ transport system membrane component KefB